MKSQASSEYLLTYMFSVLVIFLVVLSLSSMGIFSTCLIKKGQTHPDKFLLKDHGAIGSDSPTVANSFYIYLMPSEDLKVKQVKLYMGDMFCGESPPRLVGESVKFQDKYLLGGVISDDCVLRSGNCYNFDVRITYVSRSGMSRVAHGKVWGRYENLDHVYTISEWRRTDFGGSVLKPANGDYIGSYDGECPAVPPEDTSGLVLASGYETWNLPGGCDTSGITGEGFETVYCKKEAPWLANGWFTADVTTETPVVGHHLYLSGNATYEDRDDYICINDDFYFYVNDSLISMGGTAGIIDEEVIRRCGGCEPSDGWCIPPVDLTQSESYVAGGSFRIWVLVEDYCTSGGILPFWIRVV